MMLYAVCALLFTSVCYGMTYEEFDLGVFIQNLDLSKKETPQQVFRKILDAASAFTHSYLSEHPEAQPSDFPYLNFLPMWRENLIPNAEFEVT